ncbi:hypothetical protein [uncultured Tenacibaculum sp.]|uniref:hypothetical protein n=1 Tax=uncultured Tenacibaculum sp. TaxID=174713 RepID=UPI00260E0F75|nr:hypothetical protein [uncultured Tenacibaculum sp.]
MNTEDFYLKKILETIKEIKQDDKFEKDRKKRKCKHLMQIPGKNILYNSKINFNLGEVGEIPQIKINNRDSDSLLPTVVKAYFKGGIKEDCECDTSEALLVYGVAFINKSFGIINNFEVFYNFGLDFSGDYQMNIYITFTHAEELASEYNYYPFEVNFNQGAVCCAAGNPVPLEKIKMVRTYLINRDPETSRGTETAVQSGDN